MEQEKDISRLIEEYLTRKISQKDLQLLRVWENESDENKARLKELTNISELKKRVADWQKAGEKKEKSWQVLLERREVASDTPVRRLSFVRRYWHVAAAVLVIVIGTAIYLRLSSPIDHKKERADAEVSGIGNDAAPGSDRAVLQLADGKTIFLDSSASGILAKQGSLDIQKRDGAISYVGDAGNTTNVLYNTLTVPKGGQYRLLLRDGTKVWLNSASSIRYPTNFKPGGERIVEITGEVYFEVAKQGDKHRTPFIVGTAKGLEVEVLGTHFNINAYENEATVATTLLEGSVKITEQVGNKMRFLILKPGDQAVNEPGVGLSLNKNVDLQEVMAWRNGKFYFNNTDVATIMRQIARWYDVEIVYEGKIPEFKVNGEASRSLSLTNLLNMLALTDVKCKLIGNKLIIPQQ